MRNLGYLGYYLFFIGIFLIGLWARKNIKEIKNNKKKENPTQTKINITTLNEQNIIYWINYFELKEPEIVLSQIKLETGYLNSKICINNNNLLGLMKSKTEYYKFSHWIESLIFYKYKIQNRYKPNKETYYQFLIRIKYAEDNYYIKKLKQINDK